MSDPDRVIGTVDRVEPRGFGFIISADGRRIFFHASECIGFRIDDARKGDRVSFEVDGPSEGKPRALSVRREAEEPLSWDAVREATRAAEERRFMEQRSSSR